MYTNERLVDDESLGVRPSIGARREQILDAAARLFSAKGYHGTSMQDIAQEVGLLKGSLYAHVASKEELLLEIASAAARRFVDAVSPIAHGTEPPAIKLRLALRAHLVVIAQHLPAATVYLHEWRHLDGQPAAWMREEQARYEALWQGIFQEGVDRRAFRQDLNPRDAAMFALSTVNWAYRWFDHHQGMNVDDVAGRFGDLLLSGCVRASAAPRRRMRS